MPPGPAVAGPSTAPPNTAPSDALVDRARRSPNLDVLRAVAAIMVLVFHAYGLGGRESGNVAEGAFLGTRWLGDAALYFMASGVWLFFALSGYLITRPFVRSLVRGEPLPAIVPYALRRGGRIYPLYWVALTVTILILGHGAVADAGFFPFHYGLVHNLVPRRQTALLGVSWTLTLEVLFYASVPLGAWLIGRARRPVRPSRLASLVGVVWLVSIACTATASRIDWGKEQYWARGLFPAMLGMFCPGILLAVAEHGLDGSRWRWWLQRFPYTRWAPVLAVVLLAGATGFAVGLRPAGTVPDRTYAALFDLSRPLYALGFGILLARAIRARPWGGRLQGALVELGLISYGIYLIHAVVLYALSARLESLIPLPHGGTVAFVVHVLFVLALTIPLAALSWHWFERPVLERAIAFGDRWRGGRNA